MITVKDCEAFCDADPKWVNELARRECLGMVQAYACAHELMAGAPAAPFCADHAAAEPAASATGPLRISGTMSSGGTSSTFGIATPNLVVREFRPGRILTFGLSGLPPTHTLNGSGPAHYAVQGE